MEWFHWSWTTSSYVCIPACLTLILLLEFDGHNYTLFPCQHILLYWRRWRSHPHFLSKCDARCALMLAVLMHQSRWHWTNRMYVCIPMLDFEVFWGFHSLWCHDLTLIPFEIYYNGDVRCAFIFIASMEWLRWPWRAVCKFVFLCLTFVVIWVEAVCGHKLTITPGRHVLHWRWPVCVYLGWIDGTISLALDE